MLLVTFSSELLVHIFCWFFLKVVSIFIINLDVLMLGILNFSSESVLFLLHCFVLLMDVFFFM
jgi:hypothetical protein